MCRAFLWFGCCYGGWRFRFLLGWMAESSSHHHACFYGKDGTVIVDS